MPDHLEIRALDRDRANELFLLEVQGGPGFNPVDGDPVVPNRLLARDVDDGFRDSVKSMERLEMDELSIEETRSRRREV